MGELMSKVLEIHKSQLKEERENFDKQIIEINDLIIKRCKDNTNLTIDLSGCSVNERYFKYITKNQIYKELIKKWILDYYKNEGFNVYEDNDIIIHINWNPIITSELLGTDIIKNETEPLVTKVVNKDKTNMDSCLKNLLKDKSNKLYRYDNCSIVIWSEIATLCKSIATKINEGMFQIIPRNNTLAGTKPKCILENHKTYYIRTQEIYEMRQVYCDDNDIIGPEYKASTLANMLCDAGIAPRFYEGKTVRTGRKIGKYRYIEIDKQKLFMLANI